MHLPPNDPPVLPNDPPIPPNDPPIPPNDPPNSATPSPNANRRRRKRFKMGLLAVGILTVLATLIASLLTIKNSSEISSRSELIILLQIQNELRNNYRDWESRVMKAKIDLKSDAAVYNSYEKDSLEYRLLREYWGDVCYNEYLTFNKYGAAVFSKHWPFYDTLMRHGIEYRPLLCLSLCDFLKTERQDTANYYQEEFFTYLDSLSANTKCNNTKKK